jgi:outer membrane lipoprotein carrier protein
MMKKLIIVLALLASQSAYADDKADLKKLIEQINTFEASFSQKVIDVDGKAIMQGKGKVHLSHPSLIRWHALEPDENLLVSDGTTLWIYNIDLEQVTATSAKQAIDSTPFALLASHDDALWSNYKVTKVADAYVIAPIEQNGQVKQLSLYFKDQQFSQLVIEDLSQQKSEFTFSDSQSNKPLQSTLFTFTLPEGVELDDQRN